MPTRTSRTTRTSVGTLTGPFSNMSGYDLRKAQQKITQWSRHPATFIRGVLGYDLWTRQVEMCDAILSPSARVAVRGCHASSKTFTAAGLALWWLTALPDGIIITTAPTWAQVRRVMWQQIRRLANHIQLPRINQTSIELDEDNYAVGISTNDNTRFQGFHGRVLVIIDEAPGVLPSLFEAIEGIGASGNVVVLMLGNPTVAGGPFYEAFTGDSGLYQTITISAFDTPNLRGITPEMLRNMAPDDPRLDQGVWEHTVSRRWVRDRMRTWGEDSPAYLSRVLGQFPAQDPSALFGLGPLEAARFAYDDDGYSRIWAGIDVAGAGRDLTSVTLRTAAGLIVAHAAFADADARGPVLRFLEPWRPRIEQLNIDASGLGHYFALAMRDAQFAVNAVVFSSAPKNRSRIGEMFALRRDELFWNFRGWLHARRVAGLGAPSLTEAWSDLSLVKYGTNSKGAIAVESKENWSKRLPNGRSPDDAESVILAFDDTPPSGQFAGQPAAALRPRMVGTDNTGRRSPALPVAGSRFR